MRIVNSYSDVYADDQKNILFYFISNNGDKFPVLTNGTYTQIHLEPGQEYNFYFSGSINERAYEPWRTGDVSISLVYSWENDSSGEDAESEEGTESEPEEGTEDSTESESEGETGGSTGNEPEGETGDSTGSES